MPLSANGCPKKARLIDDISKVNKRLMDLHNREVTAVLNGRYVSDVQLETELAQAETLRVDLVQHLRCHAADHRC